MKKLLHIYLPLIGILFVMLFCVSAAASIVPVPEIIKQTFYKPMNLFVIGFVLIGIGNFITNRTSN